MEKYKILPVVDLQNSREYYGLQNSRDFYKGTSFKMSGEWKSGMHYFSDEYIIDFVAYEQTLWACQRSHISDLANPPSKNSKFWTEVVTGVEGKAYVPSLDENGNLIFSLEGTPPLEPIELSSLKGDSGKDGQDGLSAYEIAKQTNPNIGSETEWLQSLNGDTYKPVKIQNNLMYFKSSKTGQTITISTANLKGDKGDKGDIGTPGKDAYTSKFINEVTIYEVEYGQQASAKLYPVPQSDGNVDYRLELILPEGKPGKDGRNGSKGSKGDKGDKGDPAPTPQFKLISNTNTHSIELLWSTDSNQNWTNLGEVGGKSPKLMRVLSTTSDPDHQDGTKENDRILWGYDGIPVSQWSTLCYLDEIRGDENIWIGCDEPKMLDGKTPDYSKIWYDPCDEAVDEFSTVDFIYQSYFDSGGNLSKEEFIEAFSSINTLSLGIRFASNLEELGEPTKDKSNILWLVSDKETTEKNQYIEYIVIYKEKEDKYYWEQIGTQSLTVDLTDYYTKDEVDALLQDVSSTTWIPL